GCCWLLAGTAATTARLRAARTVETERMVVLLMRILDVEHVLCHAAIPTIWRRFGMTERRCRPARHQWEKTLRRATSPECRRPGCASTLSTWFRGSPRCAP